MVAVVVAVFVAIVMVIVMYVLVAIVARAIAMSPTQHASKKNTFYQAMRRARARIYTRTSTEPCETPAGAQVAHAMGPAAFRDDLLDRLACGRIGWLDLTTIAWHATRAGAVGVEDLALDPSAKGSNQARRARFRLGLGDLDALLYKVHIPMWDTRTSTRTMGLFIMKLPHETIAEDFVKNRPA